MQKPSLLFLLLILSLKVYSVTRTCVTSGIWSTASTWSPSGAPGVNDSAIIPSGKSVLIPSASTAKCSLLKVDGTLTVRGTLGVKGHFEINGTLDADSSTINFTGTSVQEIRGTANIVLWNAVNSNNVSLNVNSSCVVLNLLTLGNSSVLAIDLAKEITLKSTRATQTAKIPNIPTSASVTGTFVQERWAGSPGWHAIGFTADGATAAGYDETVHGDLNLGYLTTHLVKGQGGFVSASSAGQVFSNSGEIFRGTFVETMTCSGSDLVNDGWNLLANPYPCDIDIESAAFNIGSTTNTIYVWDAASSRYLWWRKGFGGTYNRLVSSGQGFWIQATSNIAYFKVAETAKTTGSTYYRTSVLDSLFLIKVSLASQNGTSISYIKLGQYDDDFDPDEDSQYLPSSTSILSEVYTKSADGFKLVLNETQLSDSIIVPIYITSQDLGINTLKFEGVSSLPSGFRWYVIYTPTGMTIDLLNYMQNLGQTPTISFYPPSTSELNYFTLVIVREEKLVTLVHELQNTELGRLVQVYDMFGKPAQQEDISAGTYIFKYVSDSGKETLVKRIVVR